MGKKKTKMYSPSDRYFYHMDRSDGDSPTALIHPKDSNRRWYSTAFCDAFDGENRRKWALAYDGRRAAQAYSVGYNRGKKAAKLFERKTGMPSSDLRREWWKMSH